MGSEEVADISCADRNAFESDGAYCGNRRNSSESCFLYRNVIGGIDKKLEGEEGRIVYVAARFKNQILKEKIDVGIGYFETWNRKILDSGKDEWKKDSSAVCEKLGIGGLIGRGENSP